MKGFCLEVNGPFACFTRPEMKVERVSYDVITPSAARAVFDAILWKPAIRWRVTAIEILSPIRWTSVRRNEVGEVASPRTKPRYIEDDRKQRAALLLRDVRYRLHAEFDYVPPEQRSRVYNPLSDRLIDVKEMAAVRRLDVRPDETEAKYAAMFERRATKGQCFNQPYLGCREFSCAFRLADPAGTDPPRIHEDRELGWMLYDLDFSQPDDPRPMFFRPVIEDGLVRVPHPDSEEVRR